MSEFPFQIDRNSKTKLPEQVADGFRKCILLGRYKPGDVLPSRKEIAAALGISVRIPREAIAILAAENFVRPRRGVGCSVLARKEMLWKGRVLMPICTEGSYYAVRLVSVARRHFLGSGYQCVCINLDLKPDGSGYDLSPVEYALRQPTDAALAVFPSANLLRLLCRRRVPCFGVDGAVGADGLRIGRSESAMTSFIAQCRSCGVERVLYCTHGADYGLELADMRSAGLEVEWMPVGVSDTTNILEQLERKAMERLMRRFAPGRPRPDLVYFADDYVARGGLTALLARSVRVPDDVKVVTLANKGYAPVFPVRLARFEVDPSAAGTFAAECVAAMLENRPRRLPCPEKSYVPGDSFPIKGTKGTFSS